MWWVEGVEWLWRGSGWAHLQPLAARPIGPYAPRRCLVQPLTHTAHILISPLPTVGDLGPITYAMLGNEDVDRSTRG